MKQCFLWDAASQISVEIFTSEDEWRTATIRYHGETDHWRKKRWAWNFGTFSAWSLKHGNSEGNSVSVKLGFALESKRKKLWPTRARAITINRFYTASPNQTQSCSFSTFLWLQMIPKNHKTGICNCWVVELHVLHAGIPDDSSIVPVSWVCARDIALIKMTINVVIYCDSRREEAEKDLELIRCFEFWQTTEKQSKSQNNPKNVVTPVWTNTIHKWYISWLFYMHNMWYVWRFVIILFYNTLKGYTIHFEFYN